MNVDSARRSDDFLELVMAVERQEISTHRSRLDLIMNRPEGDLSDITNHPGRKPGVRISCATVGAL